MTVPVLSWMHSRCQCCWSLIWDSPGLRLWRRDLPCVSTAHLRSSTATQVPSSLGSSHGPATSRPSAHTGPSFPLLIRASVLGCNSNQAGDPLQRFLTQSVMAYRGTQRPLPPAYHPIQPSTQSSLPGLLRPGEKTHAAWVVRLFHGQRSELAPLAGGICGSRECKYLPE